MATVSIPSDSVDRLALAIGQSRATGLAPPKNLGLPRNSARHDHAARRCPEQEDSSTGKAPELLDRRSAAEYLCVRPHTLASWACSGRVKLPFVKLGRRVIYRKADLDAFVGANVNGSLQ